MTTELTRRGDDGAPEPEGGKRRRDRAPKGASAVEADTSKGPKGRSASKEKAAAAKAAKNDAKNAKNAERTAGKAAKNPGRSAKKEKAAAARPGASTLHLEPRVDLLPPEVKTARRHDAIARRLVLALVVVIILVAAAIGGSTYLALQADATLAAAQQQTAALAAQQQKYVGVRQVQSQIALVKAGQEVGASTEVDWTAFLTKVRGTIGGGLSLTGITIDSASPLAAYQQSTVPLEGTRVATVTIDVRSTNLDEVSAWLAQLSGLPSVADVAPGPITLDQSGYTASAIMHLDESAFDGRYAPKGK